MGQIFDSSQKYESAGIKNMAKETTVRARIDEALKEEAEEVLRKLGLTTSQAINIYFSQIALRKGLPFDVVIPDDKQ